MTGNETLGDRMKLYEGIEAQRILIPRLPTLIRLDGKAFHTFCRGLAKPYDIRLTNLMIEVTKYLVDQSGARIGYTQSDEITLVLWTGDDYKSQPYLGGRSQKLTSILAGYASAKFNQLVPQYLPEKAGRLAVFDARAWNVPNFEEAANCLLWREQDCTKNSINSAAQAYCSHKSIQGLKGPELQEKLFKEANVNWNVYPAAFKRGTYCRSVTTTRPSTTEELAALPKNHAAHQNPALVVTRSKVNAIDMPVFSTVQNRADVIFQGCEPITGEQ